MPRIGKLLLLVFFFATPAFASDIYVAQAQAGSHDGSSCSNARAVSSLAAGDWSAGNTIHLCGTITSTITAQGSGVAFGPANVITVTFETGASITVSACGTNGCLNLSGRSYIVVVGGPVCGYVNQVDTACNGAILATGNGTGSGSGDSLGINLMSGANHIEIKNLTIANMYVHTGSGNDIAGGLYYAVHENGSSNTIHNLVCHDNSACVVGEAGTNNGDISFSQMYNENWGVFLSGPSTNTPDSITVMNIHDNDVHDMANWDTTSDTFHHNGFIIAGNNNLANGVSHVSLYNNYIHGVPSNCSNSCATAYIFVNDTKTTYTYNNLLVQTSGSVFFNGLIYYWSPGTNQSGSIIANNTVIGISGSGSDCVSIRGDASMTFQNNVISGCSNELINVYTSPSVTFTSLTNNIYQNSSLSQIWQLGSNFYSSLATWSAAVGGESGSQALTTTLNLDANNHPKAGSILIAAGANLTSLGITSLNSDAVGNLRPGGSTAWDDGAFNYVVAPNRPAGLHLVTIQ